MYILCKEEFICIFSQTIAADFHLLFVSFYAFLSIVQQKKRKNKRIPREAKEFFHHICTRIHYTYTIKKCNGIFFYESSYNIIRHTNMFYNFLLSSFSWESFVAKKQVLLFTIWELDHKYYGFACLLGK